MDIDKELKSFNDGVNEILASTAAVKGKAFADAVAVSFEGVQLMEIVSRLTGLANESSKGYAQSLNDSAMTLASSILAKSCDGLADSDLDEVMKMGSALYKRRSQTLEAINKGRRDAS